MAPVADHTRVVRLIDGVESRAAADRMAGYQAEAIPHPGQEAFIAALCEEAQKEFSDAGRAVTIARVARTVERPRRPGFQQGIPAKERSTKVSALPGLPVQGQQECPDPGASIKQVAGLAFPERSHQVADDAGLVHQPQDEKRLPDAGQPRQPLRFPGLEPARQ